jgi:hypothetical protein
MAFNGNYVKIESVLDGLSKYPFMENVTKRTAAHTLADLIKLVGATTPLERKYANVQITQNKGVMPVDVIFLHGVNNKGNSCDNEGIPMRYASDIYLSVLHSDTAKAECDAGTTINTPEQVEAIYPPVVDTPEDLDMCNNAWAPASYADKIPMGICENSYAINAMSIDTSFEDGWVELAYDSIATDDDGFPMIPDDASFKNAYKYLLIKNAAEPAFYRGDVQRHVYHDIEQQYDWYIGQASNSLKMLSPDQMQTLANAIVRLVPVEQSFKDGHRSLNKRTRYGY